MTPAELSRTVLHTVQCAVEADELPAAVPTRVTVRVPPRPGCGDFATNVALRVAQDTGRPAREVAEVLRKRLAAEPGIAGVEIAGPGFLNITLEGISYVRLVRELLSAPPRATEPLPLPDPGPALLARLGSDAARWSLLWPAGAGRAELLVQRDSNPLFRVRYAHARTQQLLRNARDLGFRSEAAEPAEYERPAAGPLLAALADHPRVTAARDPERLARHLDRTAGAFLTWQRDGDVLPRGDEKPSAVHRARLALAEATGNVLADGLHQLGITAPAHL
ncbi:MULTISPECIES: ArgS-related anticodon-binding protein NrtL [Streptomyces]|uniref:arginine--tRNA ligase n=1 Tax=Streptomyces nondiastaticus TaxID=3154512 RepID=A0ABW6TZ32_9ACTN|nr:arginine--tRNA ligase [Streptomyces sp. VNUA116]WKU47046.1 DALR anticodon-binding domain-containing protein [Streptomyces sp. VNUA116]